MVRIGHLTDIHVCDFSDLRARDFFTKRLTGWVNYRRERAAEYDRAVLDAAVARLVDEAPDLVVVSGDLTNLGLRSELRAALSALEPLRAAGIRTVVVPGNHDAYVAESADGRFERECSDWQTADARMGEEAYPFVVRTGDVACVCLSSAIPTAPLMAFGRVDDSQLARATMLARAERSSGRTVVFVVHHHPTRAPHRRQELTRGLRNVGALREVAAEVEASLILHGHNHFQHLRRLRDANDVVVVGLSCSTTNRHDRPEREARVGLYSLNSSGLRDLAFARWVGDSSAFGPWSHTDLQAIPVESEREALRVRTPI